MTSWMNDCELLDTLNIDICFCINEDFYYGPHDVISMTERKQTTPLPSPTNKPVANFNLRSLKAEQNPEKLLAYYREVLRLAKNYGKPDAEIMHYFWLKLYAWHPHKQVSLEFPWYDTLDQIAPVLEKITAGDTGLIYSDEDQGWAIDLAIQDGLLHAREGDLEEGDLNFLHKAPLAPIASECRNVLTRAKTLIAYLSDNVGDDYWSTSKHAPTISQ